MKYARYLDSENRRENWDELTTRNKNMHIKKFPHLVDEIESAYQFVYNKQVLPSMRSMQFGGKPIEVAPNRIFNCFSEDTRFITTMGTKSFSDFKDGDIVVVPTHMGRCKEAVVRSYGKQELYEISLARGRSTKTVFATKDHRWINFDGESTTELKAGDILFPTVKNINFDYDNAEPFEKLYWCYGYVYGDGSVVTSGNNKYSMARLCGKDKEKYLHRFEEMGFKTSTPLSCNGDPYVYTGKYAKTAPDPTVDSPALIKAFFDGYMAADARKNPDWYENNTLSKYRNIQTSDMEHAKFIELCSEMSGYYITNKADLTGEVTNFGTRGETYQYSLANHIGSRRNTGWVVKEVKPSGRIEGAWCLEVEDDHSFLLSGGVVTGNCGYLPVDDIRAFSETMFLLLGGTGIGYSVQKHHVERLPEIRKPNPKRTRRFLVADSIEGWADAVKALVNSYFKETSKLRFDFSDIRPKGARLVTSGGKAPGPQPLRECLVKLEGILDSKETGDRLRPIEVHDMMCYIADAVLAGGIRRAALISLFSADDDEMISAKSGKWFETNPQRGRANNSVVLMRHRITRGYFMSLWERIKASGAGEPGFYFTNDKDWGCNPCCEIGLKPFQFCNLVEINASDLLDQDDLNARATAAAFIGTLQASYTDFHYLRPIWQRTTEKDALLGASLTGIASGKVLELNMTHAAGLIGEENIRVAKMIGVNPAARTTCVKPAGTTSLTLGTSSGIHAWHNEYYIRRLRVGKNESIYSYLAANHPELIDDEFFRPHDTAVISVPQKAPEGAITRNESALDLLERIKKVTNNWVRPGYRKGQNTHNVSATITVKNEEWDIVADWMWENRDVYNGLSILPHSEHTYVQPPFEDCTKEKYVEMMRSLTDLDIENVLEEVDNTNLSGEIACSGGSCAISYL